jgi:hypothetical protein
MTREQLETISLYGGIPWEGRRCWARPPDIVVWIPIAWQVLTIDSLVVTAKLFGASDTHYQAPIIRNM